VGKNLSSKRKKRKIKLGKNRKTENNTNGKKSDRMNRRKIMENNRD